MNIRFFPAILGLAVAVTAGCSHDAKKVTVSGTVTQNGQPIHSCMIRFHGEGDSFAVGSVRDDGSYTVTDVIPGEIRVSFVEGPRNSGSSESKGSSTKTVQPAGSGGLGKYRNAESSGLQYTIKPDTKELNIDLK